jgi:tRNA (cmo5U34)-methyltransferase
LRVPAPEPTLPYRWWMPQFHFTPEHYLELMHSEVPDFDELQERVAGATEGLTVTRILELGTGTGETARRVLELHPEACLTGIDVSAEMLAQARETLPPARTDDLLVQGIQDDLPEGPFDLVISALTVHHLDGPAKANLFDRVARVLRSGGRFVMGDVVVPDDLSAAVTPLSPDYDLPSTTGDLVGWLRGSGFETRVVWELNDLAIISADRT